MLSGDSIEEAAMQKLLGSPRATPRCGFYPTALWIKNILINQSTSWSD